MKVYAINLERAVERRKHILGQLQKHELDYELIAAVDGKNLNGEELEQLCDLNIVRARPKKLTIGAIGCALSHLKVYQKMIADKADVALILEDDAVLPGGISELLQLIEKNIETNEAILLHYFEMRPEKAVLSRHNAVPLDDRYSLMYPVNFPFSGTGYVITQKTAQALCRIKLPIKAEADDWQFFYKSGAIKSLRCVYPKPLIVSQAQTQIHPATAYKDVARLRHKIYKFISENKTPIFYQMIRKFSTFKERYLASITLIDEPSQIFTQN